MSTPAPFIQCACNACTCEANADHQRDGKHYCSQACADRHPDGQPCPAADCHCESGVPFMERAISESQLDEAIEETFPASDPISP
ncbi:metallothionein family protein [Pseudomonas sp. FP2309]|uniref:metallothionein family protein n=1 Tax=Pseudomonas sp. FP2309 TaxID=2954091 RepID=UPI002737797A|nr:metallothionein family protein [Pseudomonas sp. FP2309]WLH66263.1 metallothionein family protein [Pseudomonas sp. FP2309]